MRLIFGKKALSTIVFLFPLIYISVTTVEAVKYDRKMTAESDLLTRIETIINSRNTGEAAYLRKLIHKSPFSTVRSRAIGALLLLRDRNSEKVFIEKLKHDSSPMVRMSAAYAFAEMKSKSAIGALIEASTHDADPMVRAISCRALGFQGMKGPGRVLLISLLSDPSYTVRIESAMAIASLGMSEGKEPLKGAIRKDPEKLVRVAAVRALSRLKGKDVLSFLIDEYDSATNSDYKFEVFRGIISFRGTDRFIQEGLDDRDERIRFLALKHITDSMGKNYNSNPSSDQVILLERMLKDPFKGIRDLANDTLSKKGYLTKDLGVRYELIK